MTKDPMEMAAEELDASYGKPLLLGTVTHILGLSQNANHDRFTVEVFTEDTKRLNIRFTEAGTADAGLAGWRRSLKGTTKS